MMTAPDNYYGSISLNFDTKLYYAIFDIKISNTEEVLIARLKDVLILCPLP